MPCHGSSTPPAKVRPRTTLLRPGLDGTPAHPYFLHEEEVPRAGTRLELSFRWARLKDGRVVVWLGTAGGRARRCLQRSGLGRHGRHPG